MRTHALRVTVLVVGLVGALLPAASAPAQVGNQVTGLTVRQGDGYATLSWTPVAGATEYDIERAPVAADGTPGPGVITGIWRPNRTVTPESPTFADAGFNPGDRFQWRVRARLGTEPQDYSNPVTDTTLPPWGDPDVPGENLRTQWEQTQAAVYTSNQVVNDTNNENPFTDEYEYTAALDAASERVRVVKIGETHLGRPINMFIIGHPAPPPTARAIARRTAALINCNVHGNEPSSREACFIMARELAFSQDRRVRDILRQATVLIVPTINGDGRARNTRGNLSGQDLNRDYSLIREPETFAFVEMLRDYQPEASFDGHEFGNQRAGDLPVLPPRHLNVARSIFDESRNMIEGWLYGQGSADGWWFCPYGCENGGAVGLSQETILRNTMGLKNIVGSLLEARSAGGPTRPNEPNNSPNNRRRKTYSALYTYQEFLDYQHANRSAIEQAIRTAEAFQRSNTGRIVFRGTYDIPAFPAPHPGEAPPPDDDPGPEDILDPPPCGYSLNRAQYLGAQPRGRLVSQRLEAHGIRVHRQGRDTWFVPMTQEQRGLIPLLLDGQAAEPLVAGERVYC